MEDIDDSGLSIGFSIDFRDSFGQLRTLDDLVGEAAASMFRQMQDMERATGMPIDALRNLAQEMAGAKSAADIATERQDLERQLLELRGDTAALRALQLAKLDASSRQELDRIRAMIAANLEQTNALIGATGVGTPTTNAALLNAGLFSQPTSGATNDNGAAASQLRAELTEKLEQMRKEQNAALATIAANTGRVAKKLDDVTTQSGGDAITTEARQAAA